MPSRLYRSPRPLVLLAALVAASVLALSGCDNPACVFGGDCSGVSGGSSNNLGEGPAALPDNADWLDTASPFVEGVFPFGDSADPETPVVVVFSESMQPGAAVSAFDLFLVDESQAVPVFVPVQLGPSVLRGAGRVLVLRPLAPLERGMNYELQQRENVDPNDLNGQTLRRSEDDVVGSFRVATTGPIAPLVVTTFPPAGSTFQSDRPEVVVVFSRPVDPTTVDDGSFDVTIDGIPPAYDAVPTPIVIEDLFPITDTRVYTWQSLDDASELASLGRGDTVQLVLSPDPVLDGNKILDADGNALAETTLPFDIAPFAITDAAVTSMPLDAINIENLLGPGFFDMVVSVEDVEATDNLDLFLFGYAPFAEEGGGPPPLTSLSRTVPVGTASTPGVPVDVTVGAAALDLIASTSPLQGRFLDGPVAFAFRLRRGNSYSPVTLLDVDPLSGDVQFPLLDTVPPVLVGLGASGTNLTSFRSDQADLVVVGRATEPIGAAFVSSTLGANGTDPMNPPEVVGSNGLGLFVARPITVTDGIIPPASLPVTFDLTIFDAALNPAPVPTTASYTQLGVSGPNPLAGQIGVVVHDASTLSAVAGARVFAHADDGMLTTLLDEQVTAADGSVQLATPLAGGEELIVTVSAPGYDLFTLHGAVTNRLGVPLQPSLLADGRARGTVTSPASLSTTNRSAADTRFPESLPRLVPVAGCSLSGQTLRYECPFGPEFVAARRLGSESALVTTSPANESQYSAFTFLVGFELAVPVEPVAPNATVTTFIDLPFLLNDLGTDFEELAIDVPVHTLDTSLQPGGASSPRVTLEALSPGVGGALTVGAGLAFAQAVPETWRVRSAYPGAVDPFLSGGGDQLGRYVSSGTIESDLFLRVEQTDSAGNRGIARPRLSMTSNSLMPPAASTLLVPPPGGNSGGASYELVFTDVLRDGPGGPQGLYRATLTGSDGRLWTLYRVDPSDAAMSDVRIKVPDLTPMGTALPDGVIGCSLSAFAWPGLTLQSLVWSDLEREPTRISHSAELTFTQP